MKAFNVGAQLWPQHCTVDELRAAWRAIDAMGADSIWTWDHFFPISGDSSGAHFECYSLLAAMAVDTSSARLGTLVTCASYRNPDLLASMAATIDQLSGGRFMLGLGAGWFERDFAEYGYDFPAPPARLRVLTETLQRIERRLSSLNPGPVADLPILIGGGGEKVTLRIVAEHGTMWNFFGPPDNYARKSRVLDEWCRKLNRDPKRIERTVMIRQDELDLAHDFVAAGAEHLILGLPAPFDVSGLESLLDMKRAARPQSQ